jgi:hypothetical protein
MRHYIAQLVFKFNRGEQNPLPKPDNTEPYEEFKADMREFEDDLDKEKVG